MNPPVRVPPSCGLGGKDGEPGPPEGGTLTGGFMGREMNRRAMSLIEIMVAMALLTVIMLGLFSAFYHTQRALKMSGSQTDVLEGGRATLSLLVRELQEMAASHESNCLNLMISTPTGGGLDVPVPGDVERQTNVLQDAFFMIRDNDVWSGISYFITIKGEGVGTLWRQTAATNRLTNANCRLADLYAATTNAPVGRVADGIVHISVRAFDVNGMEYAPGKFYTASTNIVVQNDGLEFYNETLPAWIDVELGIVDPQVYRQFKNISPTSPAGGVNFLRSQAGKMYLFRQRINIRNHHEP